ncbi:hypothetical protein NQ314_019481 [Rhamnusium bicolor]|uniref:MADF domain-containing protein n=1 Tax=Rhamnusium bicolor TaxID=1586634 RepID=A0AAV8WMK0_9CUCU|nr:hypothetical protein NQ314_019481 [Rhamnusium bicolor]
MDIERFIEEVLKFPVLYDQTKEKYRNSEYKDRIWKKIATDLEAKGAVKECKKKWASIRDQLRRTLQKRKTVSGQAAVRHHKYKYEDLLKFLIPHIADRETISNVSYSQEGEEEVDEQESNVNTQQEDSIVEEESMQQINIENEPAIENWETQIENVTNSSQPSQTASAGSFVTSTKKDKFVKPLLKRKIQYEVKSQESASSQLMAYILAEKQAEKEAKRPTTEMAEQNPVDAFLAGIAPPLKSLDPILFNQAKGSVSTPYPSPVGDETLNHPESGYYHLENTGQTSGQYTATQAEKCPKPTYTYL